jgi:hypothetical protein
MMQNPKVQGLVIGANGEMCFNKQPVTSHTLFKYEYNEGFLIALAKTDQGRKLLSETRDNEGKLIFPALVGRHEGLAFELMGDEEGMELLKRTKNDEGESALHVAVIQHERVALRLTETPDGITLLAETVDDKKESALLDAVRFYKRVALGVTHAEDAAEARARWTYLDSIVNNKGFSVLDEAMLWSEVAVEMAEVTGGNEILAELKQGNSRKLRR